MQVQNFVVQSIGVYENREIVKLAAKILYEKFLKLIEDLDSNIVSIVNSETIMDNCFDIILENVEDMGVANHNLDQ